MVIKTFVSASVAILAICAAPLAQSPQTPAPPGYAWAESCRSCHEAIYAAWAKTKHARALDRLSGAEQEQPCVGCHLTGSKTRVLDNSKVLNRGVQCEACHGPGAAHASDPSSVTTGLTRTPEAAVCEECHSAKSPHFRGFHYAGMAPLSHKGQ
jgi:hypothetical protein